MTSGKPPQRGSSIAAASMILTAATLLASGANYALNLLLARWMSPSEFGDANLIVTFMLGLTAVGITLQLIAAQRVSSAPEWRQPRRHLLGRSWRAGVAIAVLLAATSVVLRDATSSQSAVPFVILAAATPFYLAQSVERLSLIHI